MDGTRNTGASAGRAAGGWRWFGRRTASAVVALALTLSLPGCDFERPAPDSQQVGCDVADERVSLTVDSHLDPSCVYTGGFDISTSDVTLDCRGALIRGDSSPGSRGIEIEAPEGSDLSNVTVRGCRVEGFLNSIRITREGFRDLEPGEEYLNETRDIVIENSWLEDSRGVGLFVDGYVSDVTIRGNVITRAGSAGIYLETGSRRNLVERNLLLDNGYRENGPDGQATSLGGVDFWFWGIGREGIAVDGSYENTIRFNSFSGNSAGGIFLYKNCGEYPDRPVYFERRTPSDDNLIAGNVFSGGVNGVWVGSRMGENTLPMECTDPAYIDTPIERVVLDYAANNVVRGNVFHDVTHAIRVEDDGTEVSGNFFLADSPDHHAVLVGTPHRTAVLGRPVRGTIVRGNFAAIAGNASPYRWAHGHEDTEFDWNWAEAGPAEFCEGEPIPRVPFIFAIAVTLAPPGGEPPEKPAELMVPTLPALPPCP
ncbi:MAG: right-handed parallel beta-helix repeat-containing protein [Myxococcota bacterium]